MDSDLTQTKTLGFESIVRECEACRSASTADQIPDLRNYLQTVETRARPTLLRNLLLIELKRRRALGEQPTFEELVHRFPDYTTVVRQALVDSSIFCSLAPVTASQLSPRTQSWEGKPTEVSEFAVSRLGDYQLLKELGKGGMGTVYDAVHTKLGHRVALKTLPEVSANRLHAFKREFRAMAGINHPHLIGLQTLEADGPFWFLTMELIDGVDFISFVRPGGILDETKLRDALAQLGAAVMALHARQIIHRDLKPSNVMVTNSGQVKVLDFGLVHEVFEAAERESLDIAGTPAYMAPEQAAGARCRGAADWYAVGVMLYEALTGHRPFQGKPLEVMRAKQVQDAPEVHDPGLPPDLKVLCARLLARSPASRPDALEIVATISRTGDSAPTLRPRYGELLIGRDTELALLQQALHALQAEATAKVVWIQGMSGEGKTSVAEQFLAPLRKDARFTVLSTRCYDRESVPFKALDGIIDALAFQWQTFGAEAGKALVPADIEFLVHLFPVLRRVEVVERAVRLDVSGLDRPQVRQRAFMALRELLGRIAAETPLVLFADDLQWGDGDSAAALLEVLRGPDGPRMLLVGTYRSDEATESRFLQAWDNLRVRSGVEVDQREIQLTPLTVEQCRDLMIHRLGKDSPMIRRRADEFAAKTGGNPFLLVELIDCFDPDTSSFEVLEMSEVLQRKLGRLPQESRALLEVIAVSGKSLALEEVSHAAGHDSVPFATLIQMRNENLVRLTGQSEQPLVDTYHDKIRETTLGQLADVQLRARHQALGETIERIAQVPFDDYLLTLKHSEPPSVPACDRLFDLAFHFDHANAQERALVYSLLAAEQAKRQFDNSVAMDYFQTAQRWTPSSAGKVRYRIDLGLAESLHSAGKYEGASSNLQSALACAETAKERAAVHLHLGIGLFRTGLVRQGVDHFETALGELQVTLPRTAIGLAFRTTELRIRKWLNGQTGCASQKPEEHSKLNLLLQLLGQLSNAVVLVDVRRAARLSTLGTSYAQLDPESPLAPHVHIARGIALGPGMGIFLQAEEQLNRAVQIASARNDLQTQASASFFSAQNAIAAGKFSEAMNALDTSLRLSEKTGNAYLRSYCYFGFAVACFYLGDIARCIELCRTAAHTAIQFGQSRQVQLILCYWERVTNGNVPFDEVRSMFREVTSDDGSAHIGLLVAESIWHRRYRRTRDALRCAEEAVLVFHRMRLGMYVSVQAFGNLSLALRDHAETGSIASLSECRGLRRRSLAAAHEAVRWGKRFPCELPCSLRELACTMLAVGKPKPAWKVLRQSCAIGELQGAKYELAQSRLAEAELACQLGFAGATQRLVEARSRMDEFEFQMRTALNPESTGHEPRVK